MSAVLEHQGDIDALIVHFSPDWSLQRLVGTDRAILRLALCELGFLGEETPANVVINEAVELAKLYGNDTSGRFVNGVLGSYLRDQQASLSKK